MRRAFLLLLFLAGAAQAQTAFDWHLPPGVAPPPVPAGNPMSAEITGGAADEGAIRTPSLRNVALTGPYMHDGSIAKLADAIAVHLKGDGTRDAELKRLSISPSQEADLLAFLDSLSDRDFVTNPDLALPRTACGKPP